MRKLFSAPWMEDNPHRCSPDSHCRVGFRPALCIGLSYFLRRFTVNDGEIYYYSHCTTTVVGGHTYHNCYDKAGSAF